MEEPIKKIFLELKDIKNIDFNSEKMKKKCAEIERENREMIENSKVDRSKLHISFDI